MKPILENEEEWTINQKKAMEEWKKASKAVQLSFGLRDVEVAEFLVDVGNAIAYVHAASALADELYI